MVWDDLEAQGKITKRELTTENPFWSGVVYAVTPAREFSCGTNTISDEGIALNVNWTNAAIRGLMPFVQIEKLEALFEDLVRGKVENRITREAFSSYEIFNEAGRFTLLEIKELPGDAFYEMSRALSSSMTEAVEESAAISKLMTLKSIDKNSALIIFYHELMWETLERLSERNLISKPLALTDPSSAAPADFGKLAFVVKSVQKQ